MKYTKTLLLSFLALPIFTLNVWANSAEIIPSDIDFVLEYKPSNSQTATGLIKNSFIPYITTSIQLKENDFGKFALELIATKETIFTSYVEKNEIFLLIKANEDEYNSAIREYQLAKIEDGYYDTADGSIMTYNSGYLVFGESLESLKNFLSSETKLSSNTEYQTVNENLNATNFIKIYSKLNDAVATEIFGDPLTLTTFGISTLKNGGISITENKKGLEIKTYGIQDPEKNPIASKNVRLTTFAPNKNVIAFGTQSNFFNFNELKNAGLTDALKNEINDDYHELADLNLLIDIFGGEVSFTLQNNGRFFPELTFMADVKENAEMQTKINNLITLATTSLQEIEFKDSTLEIKEIEIKGKKLNQFIFEFQQKGNKNPYTPKFKKENLTFTITTGITNDGVFLISSNPNIDKEYGQGFMTDQNKSAVQYFNFQELNAYLNNAINIIDNSYRVKIADFNALKENITLALSPWGISTETAEKTDQHITSTSIIEIDLAKAAQIYNSELWEKFENTKVGNLLDASDFNDVYITQWFGDDVYYLNAHGIISGYSDGNFKPENSVNRAEFIKMLMETLEAKGLKEKTNWYYEYPFKDFKSWAWFYDYATEAHELGYVKGYTDGSFRAENTITRAEAAQIIANVLAKYDINTQTSINFKDVKESDWFNNAIKVNVAAQILNGKNADTFDPNGNLNRAEAAKIFRKLLDMEI